MNRQANGALFGGSTAPGFGLGSGFNNNFMNDSYKGAFGDTFTSSDNNNVDNAAAGQTGLLGANFMGSSTSGFGSLNLNETGSGNWNNASGGYPSRVANTQSDVAQLKAQVTYLNAELSREKAKREGAWRELSSVQAQLTEEQFAHNRLKIEYNRLVQRLARGSDYNADLNVKPKVAREDSDKSEVLELNSDTCGVCAKNASTVTALPCEHTFCAACTLKWSKSARSDLCPCCSQPVSSIKPRAASTVLASSVPNSPVVDSISPKAGPSKVNLGSSGSSEEPSPPKVQLVQENEALRNFSSEGSSSLASQDIVETKKAIQPAGTTIPLSDDKPKEKASGWANVVRQASQDVTPFARLNKPEPEKKVVPADKKHTGVPENETDPFWKTALCHHYQAGRCVKTRKQCPFAHGPDDLRVKKEQVERDPNTPFRGPLWKTQLCHHFKLGHCKHTKETCAYAHGPDDLKVVPTSSNKGKIGSNSGPAHPLWKTQICHHWENGTCIKERKDCPFAHGEKDLKILQPASTHTLADHM